MVDFYDNLRRQPVKADALRLAQLSLLRRTTFLQDQQLRRSGETAIALPEDIPTQQIDLTHPFYWSSFILIGSPW
jgi:CHAT domain-containing protein